MIVVSSNISCKGLVKAEFFFKGAKGSTERVAPTTHLMLSWQNDTKTPLYNGYFLCSWNIGIKKEGPLIFLNTHNSPTSIRSFVLNRGGEFRRNEQQQQEWFIATR